MASRVTLHCATTRYLHRQAPGTLLCCVGLGLDTVSPWERCSSLLIKRKYATPRRKKVPKRVLALADLEQLKAAVSITLTSASGQRKYDHAIREFAA